MTAPPRVQSLAVIIAPGVFVLLWSTGFVGAKYGLPDADPLTLLAIRLALAAALLAGLAAIRQASWPTPVQYRQSALAGMLRQAGYLGGVFTAISLGVPASVTAVVVSLQPVLTAASATRALREPLRRRQIVGLVAGFAGAALVLAPGLAASVGHPGALPPWGVAACLLALLTQTLGTLLQKRNGAQIPLLTGSATQYATAAVVLLVLDALVGHPHVHWTGRLVAALAWLVLPLSLGAVLLLFWLLRRGSAVAVTSLFFLVPPATALEAHLLFGEALTLTFVLGLAISAGGVALVVVAPRRSGAGWASGQGWGRRST